MTGKGGDGPTGRGAEQLLQNPIYAPFSTEAFDVAEFTSRVLAGSQTTAQAQSEQLRDGVRHLEGELAAEVTSKNKDLLRNVKRMLDAEVALGDVVLSVDSLQSAVRRIRAEIAGPYEHIRARAVQLSNIHATVDLLRHLIHRIKLTQKLRAQMQGPSGTLDLAKAAKLITDIRTVDAEVDLSGIDVVEADAEFIRSTAATVQELAESALAEGMESMSQAKVGSALQVFFNLEQLNQAVNSLISRYIHDLEKAARACVDARQLSAAAAGAGPGSTTGLLGVPGGVRGISTPTPGTGASWQDKLWSGLKELADTIASSATAVWHLQRVVAKKKDPLTHVCFLDVLVPPDQPLLCKRFWDDVVRVLAEVFASVSRPSAKGGFVRDALVSGYPRLAQTLEAIFDRLSSETSMKGVLPAVTPDQLQQLLGATAPVQGAYLASCLSRMSDAVVSAFPGGARSLASPADVQKCIGVMHEELKAGAASPQLAAMVAVTAGKALALLGEKAEYMAATGPDVRSVAAGTAATSAQARNIALCSQLQEVHRSLGSLLPRLPGTAAPALAAALDTLQGIAIEVVAPIFRSVMESLEERLSKMHSSSFAADGSEGGVSPEAAVVNTSPHITECVALISHFRSEFLSRFVPVPSPNVPSCVGALVERMAARLLIFFVRHATLVRPLGQVGKLQLAKDMAELQMAVGASLFPLEQLGQPYRVLKAFRALLFAEPSAVLSSPLLRELPPVVTAHHLLSRLPAEVQAPHERSGLSHAQYSLWLDAHTPEEALRGMQAAVEAGSTAVATAGPQAQELAQVLLQVCSAGLQAAA